MRIQAGMPVNAPMARAAEPQRSAEPVDAYFPGPRQGVPEWQQPLRPLALRTVFACHPWGLDLRHYAVGAFTAVRGGMALYHLGRSLRAVPAEAHMLRLKAAAEASSVLALGSVLAGLAPPVVGIGVTRSSFVLLRAFNRPAEGASRTPSA